MMSIYHQIDRLFQEEQEPKPRWAEEILKELAQLKRDLQKNKSYVSDHSKKPEAYYAFVKMFRALMKADVEKGVYPTLFYEGEEFGIDYQGLLYNKQTQKILSREEAFALYEYAYKYKDSLDIITLQ